MLPEDQYVAYELKGKILSDALVLNILKNIAPAHKDAGYHGDEAAYQRDLQSYSDALGQSSPAIRIKVIDGCAPRAYAYVPEIYIHPGDEDRVFMFSPIDFKGRHFMPAKARPLFHEERKKISYDLWGEGFISPEAVIEPAIPYGVQVPADFDRKSAFQNFTYLEAPFDHKKTYDLLKALNFTKNYLASEKAIAGIHAADEFDFKYTVTTEPNGRPGLLAWAERKGDQARLTINANAYFTPVPLGMNIYKIAPQPKTAGGMALQSFFDAVPPLSGEDIWAICDEEDRLRGIKPPPPPLSLLHLYPQAPWPFPRSAPTPAPLP